MKLIKKLVWGYIALIAIKTMSTEEQTRTQPLKKQLVTTVVTQPTSVNTEQQLSAPAQLMGIAIHTLMKPVEDAAIKGLKDIERDGNERQKRIRENYLRNNRKQLYEGNR